ncbi:Tyrosinase [Arthrobotrys entomopaga]|nr:Tyrosinase [Arthrobotrys entomopaga]
MVAWSSMKTVAVATLAVGFMGVDALPSEFFRRAGQNTVVVTGVTQGLGPAQGQVPLRKEIREMIANPAEFNLFVLAMQRFQAVPQSDDMGYYGVAGIHGRPFKPWNGVASAKGSMPDAGYCTHKDVLFLPWHRPYLALYEQVLWQHAKAVVDELPAAKKAEYQAILPSFRIPYWDWATNATIPREIGEMVTIQVDGPKGKQTIANPLYSYKFTDVKDFADVVGPLANATETVRSPQEVNGKLVSDIGPLNKVMESSLGAVRGRVYAILMQYKDFNGVSTAMYNRFTHRALDSFEGIHDDIHNAIGGPIGGIHGHMADISLAAFDPIFWLHHTNIDRLFAMWQSINPDGYTLSGTSGFGTFSLPTGTQEDLNTPLTPFHQSGSAYFTSATSGKTQTFGYAYAENNDWNIPADKRVENAIATVNRLYGEGTSAGAIGAAMLINMPPVGGNFGTMPPNQPLNIAPAARFLSQYKDSIVSGGKYNDWTTEIQVNGGALDGMFKIYVFFGDAAADTTKWDTSLNLIGSFSVLGEHKVIAKGSVPLTNALLNEIVMGEITNLQTATVTPYLTKKLNIKAVNTQTGKVVDIKTVTDLKVVVSTSVVTLPKGESEAPQWAESNVAITFIDVANGVIAPK